MLKAENWVGEYTSTIGDGTITLGGPIDGFCGFANVGTDVEVYYTIMDGANKETGIGTVTGNSLTRDTIHAVLLDGTYTKGGSPLILSGDAQVYLTANAHFLAYVQSIDQMALDLKSQVAAISQWSINGHPLTANFLLDAAAVGARPDTWMPTADEVGAYSKSSSDNRYVATARVEGSTDPDYKIMVTDGPRDKEIDQKIDNVAVTFIGANPPQNPPEGKKWYDTNSGRSYIYLNDGDSLQWVEESPQGNGLVDTSPLLIGMTGPDFGSLGFRNILINGDFKVNQRGFTQTTLTSSSAIVADRWQLYSNEPLFVRAWADSDAQFNNGGSGIACQATGAPASFELSQKIESVSSRFLSGKKFTLSFDAIFTSFPSSLVASVWTASQKDVWATGSTVVQSIAIQGSDVQKRYSVTFNSIADLRNGLLIKLAGAGVTGTMMLSNFQLESSDVATPFEKRPYGLELQLCQRYYQEHKNLRGVATPNAAYAGASWIIPVKLRADVTPSLVPANTVTINADTATVTAGGISYSDSTLRADLVLNKNFTTWFQLEKVILDAEL